MNDKPKDDQYFMHVYAPELERLKYQHKVLTDHFGTLVLAPVDLSKPGLRILDSGTADGVCIFVHTPCLELAWETRLG